MVLIRLPSWIRQWRLRQGRTSRHTIDQLAKTHAPTLNADDSLVLVQRRDTRSVRLHLVTMSNTLYFESSRFTALVLHQSMAIAGPGTRRRPIHALEEYDEPSYSSRLDTAEAKTSHSLSIASMRCCSSAPQW